MIVEHQIENRIGDTCSRPDTRSRQSTTWSLTKPKAQIASTAGCRLKNEELISSPRQTAGASRDPEDSQELCWSASKSPRQSESKPRNMCSTVGAAHEQGPIPVGQLSFPFHRTGFSITVERTSRCQEHLEVQKIFWFAYQVAFDVRNDNASLVGASVLPPEVGLLPERFHVLVTFQGRSRWRYGQFQEVEGSCPAQSPVTLSVTAHWCCAGATLVVLGTCTCESLRSTGNSKLAGPGTLRLILGGPACASQLHPVSFDVILTQ